MQSAPRAHSPRAKCRQRKEGEDEDDEEELARVVPASVLTQQRCGAAIGAAACSPNCLRFPARGFPVHRLMGSALDDDERDGPLGREICLRAGRAEEDEAIVVCLVVCTAAGTAARRCRPDWRSVDAYRGQFLPSIIVCRAQIRLKTPAMSRKKQEFQAIVFAVRGQINSRHLQKFETYTLLFAL